MARKQWQDKERRDQKVFGSKPTPRSGGLWFAKGDSKSQTFLIENKTSAKERFSITSEVWKKIELEALRNSRIPLLSVEFGKEKHEIVVLDMNDFVEILDKLEHYKTLHEDEH